MRDAGPVGVQRGRRAPRTTIPDPAAVRPPDLVNRNFAAQRPDQLWLSDLTYVPTLEGFLAVAFVMDAYSRRIVGWQTADAEQRAAPDGSFDLIVVTVGAWDIPPVWVSQWRRSAGDREI